MRRPLRVMCVAGCLLLMMMGRVDAQSGLRVRGHFIWGVEVSALAPCGVAEVYWVSLPADLRGDLVDRYTELATEPYDRIYVEVGARPDTGPTVGFAADYDALWRLTRVDSVAAAAPSDCMGVPAPVWSGAVPNGCDGSTTRDMVDCMTAQLVSADQTVNLYATEALTLAADPEGFFRATDAWEEYRDLHCAAAAEQWAGGSIRPVQYLGCRLGLSEARLLEIWDAYLERSGTSFADPRGDRDVAN